MCGGVIMAGQFYQQAIANLQRRRDNRAAMELYRDKVENERIRTEETRAFQRANMIFEQITTVLNRTNSPAEANYWLEQFSGSMKQLKKSAPGLYQAIQVANPQKILSVKHKAWLMKNGPRQELPSDFDVSKNPAYAMSVKYQQLKYDRRRAKDLFGTEMSLQGIYDLDGNYSMQIDSRGTPKLLNWESLNEDPVVKEFRTKHGISEMEFRRTGGWTRMGSQVTELEGDKIAIIEFYNPLTKESRYEQQRLGKGGTGAGKKPGLPKQEVWEAVLAISRGEYTGKNPEVQGLFDTVHDLQDQYQDDPKGFARELDRVLSLASPGFTYLIDSPQDKPAFGREFWSRNLKLNENTRIRMVPGRPIWPQTKDGVKLELIYDPASGSVCNNLGERIEGSYKEILQRIGSETAEELGIRKPVKTAPPPPTNRQEKSMAGLLSGLPENVKEWDVQMLFEQGKQVPYIMLKRGEGVTEPQRLTTQQYEFFRRYSGKANLGEVIQILKDVWNMLPKESKLPSDFAKPKEKENDLTQLRKQYPKKSDKELEKMAKQLESKPTGSIGGV